MIRDSNLTPAWLRNWMQVRWKRITLAIALVIAILFIAGVTAWFFKPWSAARDVAKADPHLSDLPAPLSDTTLATLKPNRIERFGTTFQVPWDGIDAEKDGPGFALILFKNGPSVMFFKPLSAAAPSRMLTNGLNGARLDSLFSPKVLASGYEWEKAILSATPDQLEWWNRSQNKRLLVLLDLKSSELGNATFDCNISNHDFRGFQIGDPGSGNVRLKLYDTNNRVYEFLMTPRKGTTTATQSELNAFISSLRPIPYS